MSGTIFNGCKPPYARETGVSRQCPPAPLEKSLEVSLFCYVWHIKLKSFQLLVDVMITIWNLHFSGRIRYADSHRPWP